MNGPMASGSNAGMSGSKFPQTLVNQTPVFDKRRKHNKGPKKHRGNLYRAPKFVK